MTLHHLDFNNSAVKLYSWHSIFAE